MPELKTRIREFRAKTGMTQGELADRVDVRRETIIRLEKGLYNPSLKLAMDIAAVFGTTVEMLFSFSGDSAE
ncbi:MAG: helix-turn-helix transcriptional regulator [Oscillospiraceae bacterium]|nr:helix-turn-helix transcriptional regulator [Oscillospiraceae bacterium]